MEKTGIYVHIPFCVRKCAYCDFASFANREEDMPRYVEALCREIRTRAEKTGKIPVDTVFFGGGTPSLLPPALFEKIAETLRECFCLDADAEFTVESNPGTLTEELARTMKKCGVNRLSMGMQCAQRHLLKSLGRIHGMEDVVSAAAIAREAGIERLNLDLMLGLPGQTKEDMAETLEQALQLHPDHISCYALIVEDGTPLKERLEKGEITLPGDELDREMYEMCRETLEKHGFHQYEISNFALDECECRHNVNCWRYHPYLGFGSAAHSFYGGERRANPSDMDAYLAGEAPETERISEEDAMFEYVMLGLRLTRGISLRAFEERFHSSFDSVYGERLQEAFKDGRLVREGDHIRLSVHGMDVMNSVLVALL
ncbi:MAG: radical SAM family heme chaperone HemW [Clostridia bacterium]|nr:radical SAM family heme chaperone HemW [Clostridia bacterium]